MYSLGDRIGCVAIVCCRKQRQVVWQDRVEGRVTHLAGNNQFSCVGCRSGRLVVYSSATGRRVSFLHIGFSSTWQAQHTHTHSHSLLDLLTHANTPTHPHTYFLLLPPCYRSLSPPFSDSSSFCLSYFLFPVPTPCSLTTHTYTQRHEYMRALE